MVSIRLYIDPATGSMLFSVLLGVFITAGFFLRMLFIKMKTAFGGKAVSANRGFNKILIYTDDKRYWNSYESILDEFEKRKTDVAFWTSSEDDPVFSKEYKYVHPEFIGAGNKAFVKLNSARADVLLSTTPGLDVLQWKRSKGVKKYVHFFHGPSTALGYGMFQIDFFDAMLTTSDLMTQEVRMLERKRGLPPKEIEVIGLPYFDYLSKRRMEAKTPAKQNKTILLAPSWGPSSFLYKFGEQLIGALVDTGYEIVFRPHPQSFESDKEILESILDRYGNCGNFRLNTDNDNFDILSRSDLLISDFSDVVFDFAFIFGKPIMYTPINEFDNNAYDYVWADKKIWKFEVLPTIGCELSENSISDIKSRIDETISSDKYEQGIKKAREQVWHNQGHAAESVCDYLTKLQILVSGATEVE